MAVVGILGGNAKAASELFWRMCQAKGQPWVVEPFVAAQHESGIWIAGTDTVLPDGLYPGGVVITYGFNPYASVTASSIAEGAIQVCIQRGFRSISQRVYEPQEFRADCPAGADPLSFLGALTACAVCDLL